MWGGRGGVWKYFPTAQLIYYMWQMYCSTDVQRGPVCAEGPHVTYGGKMIMI